MHRQSLCVAVVVGILSSAAVPRAAAQLAAPGESGVVMGHLHLAVHDLDAHRQFWSAFGGTPVQNGAEAFGTAAGNYYDAGFLGTFVGIDTARPFMGNMKAPQTAVGIFAGDACAIFEPTASSGPCNPSLNPNTLLSLTAMGQNCGRGATDTLGNPLSCAVVPMTKDQVRFILGTPLVTDLFHADRWDYVYRFKPGHGEAQQRRFVVYFAEGKLARLSGDVVAEAQSATEPQPAAAARVIDIQGEPSADARKDVKPEDGKDAAPASGR
jgi:hypothetical protein